MFRDPRYLAPLGVLFGVIFVAAIAAHAGSGRTVASGVPATFAASGAGDETAVSPASTSTPDSGAIDARRIGDLVRIRDAMLGYRQVHGKFPVTNNGMSTLCVTPSDPGCVLAPVPFSDGEEPYWFLSDGSRVVVAVRALATSDATHCPAALPPALAGVPLLCLQFERPVR